MKKCPITKKKSMVATTRKLLRGHYNPTSKKRRYPNLQKKKIYIPELDKTLTLELSTKGWKTINKHGAYATLKKAGII